MRSAETPWSTCWSRRPTPAISATARAAMPGATAAASARLAGCGPRDLRDGKRIQRRADELRGERRAPAPRGHHLSCPVRPHHSGGELDDRPRGNDVRSARPVCSAGRTRPGGAVRRLDDRVRARVARSRAASPGRRCLGRRDPGRCRDLGAARAALARRRLGGRLPALRVRRPRGLYPARAPAARRCRGRIEPHRARRRFGRLPFSRLRLARIPCRPGGWQSLDGTAVDPGRLLAAPARRAARAVAGLIFAHHTQRVPMNATFDVLRKVTTATITTMLLKKGIRRCWMNGPKPLVFGGERIVGPAFTLRFVPAREDLATPESWAKPVSTRGAIEEMPEGCIAVADAMGVVSAGIFGDILTMRMKRRGVAALV